MKVQLLPVTSSSCSYTLTVNYLLIMTKALNILTKPGVTAGTFHFGLDVIHVTEKR